MRSILKIIGVVISVGLLGSAVLLWVDKGLGIPNQSNYKTGGVLAHTKSAERSIAVLNQTLVLGNSSGTTPELITVQSGKNGINTYWNSFDFTAGNYVACPDLLKQPTLIFLRLLGYYPEEKEVALTSLMKKTLAADTVIIRYMIDEVLEKYLFRPGSPGRDDDSYLFVIESILKSDRISQLNKTRFEFQQQLLKQNRVGNIAGNFDFITKKGERSELTDIESEYLILYFNNPDCEVCRKVASLLSNSVELNQLIVSGRLTVLSIYADNDESIWKKSCCPKNWISAFNKSQIISRNNLYDLRAIPTLYLLDKDKQVLIKDGLLEEIISYLDNNISEK